MEDEDDYVESLFAEKTEDTLEDIITLKFDTYRRNDEELKLALVSKHHSLWAEFVYNAARVLGDRINSGLINCKNLKCLELGAGAGLPGLLAGLNGASEVVISDYGTDFDISLVYAIDYNIQTIFPLLGKEGQPRVSGVGYVWGYPVNVLLDSNNYYQPLDKTMLLEMTSFEHYKTSKLAHRIDINVTNGENNIKTKSELQKFDLVFLADLIFNRSQHQKLLWTVKECLSPVSGICYVTFSHHDPQKKDLDLNFFELAASEEYQFTVQYIGEEVRQSYPFVEADGLDAQRGVVYIYTLQLL